jgi:hypothetical protein
MNHLEKIKDLSGEDRKNALFGILDSKAIEALSNFHVSESFVVEGLRKIDSYENGRHKATVYKDSEWGEYRVKFHTDGKHLVDADHHDSDKEGAVDTAKAQVDWLHAKDTKKDAE